MKAISLHSAPRRGAIPALALQRPTPAVAPVRFALWTLRDEAAHRR